MRDFIQFIRSLFAALHYIRGILFMFVILLAGCTIILVVVERIPLRDAAYLVLITALTIGYGDITPQTGLGKITSVFVGMLGLLMNGIVVAVAVQALSQSIQQKMAEKRSQE